jgi:phage-related protein
MAEIDNLEIRVASDADVASRALDRLASSASRVRGAARGATDSVRDFSGAVREDTREVAHSHTETGRAERTVRSFGRSAEAAGRAAKKGTSGIAGFWQALKRVAYYRFIRSIIKGVTQAFGEGIKNLYNWSKAVDGTFAKSMDRIATSALYLKNSLAAMVSPLINAVAPAIDFIIDKIVSAMNWVNQFFAALTGAQTYTVAKKVAAKWDDTSKKVKNNAKSAADSIKRTILGFDEINKLDKPNTSSGGGSSGSGVDTVNYKNMFTTKNLSGNMANFGNALTKAMSTTMGKITTIVSGSSLALGAILTFSGANIPLGIGLMIAGASGLASAVFANWVGLSANIKSVVSAVEAVLAGGLLAVGAVMAFSGANIPLGIGLMVAGAGTLGAAVSLSWGTLVGNGVGSALKNITTIVSGLAVGVGAVLAFSGVNVPLGIGLMAGGIAGIAASLAWGTTIGNSISNTLKNIIALVSAASLGVGAILAFSGVNIPVGIGLMVAGVAGTAVSMKWGALNNSVSNSVSNIAAVVSAASLAIGAILALSGVNIPLGIGLIAVGVAGTMATLNWGSVSTSVGIALSSIMMKVGGASMAIGAILALTGVNVPLGVGMIAAGASGVAMSVDWDYFANKMASVWDDIRTKTARTWNKLKTGASGMATSVKTSVTTAWNSISNWTSQKWDNVKSTATSVWGNLKVGAADMAEWVSSRVSTAWNNASNWTSSKWTSIKTNAANIWGNMKSNAETTFTSISGFASEKWSAIRTSLSGFAGWLSAGFSNAWSNAWNGIVSAFSSIFQKIKEYAKSPINSVITFINSLIAKVESAVNAIRRGLSNAIKIDIPSKTLFSAFGQTVSTPRIYWKPLNLSDVTFGRIKYLAEGGILNMPTMLAPNVMAGEAGREAVLPLEQNTEWMDAVADRVVRRMGGSREVAILQSILEVLREVNDKPFTTEVTASDVQRAMNRKNVRTGAVVVPVSNG